MNPTIAQFNALLARVNQLDGANLPPETRGVIAQITAQVAGLQETINQGVLAMEAELNTLAEKVQVLQTLYNTLAGVASS